MGITMYFGILTAKDSCNFVHIHPPISSAHFASIYGACPVALFYRNKCAGRGHNVTTETLGSGLQSKVFEIIQ